MSLNEFDMIGKKISIEIIYIFVIFVSSFAKHYFML